MGFDDRDAQWHDRRHHQPQRQPPRADQRPRTSRPIASARPLARPADDQRWDERPPTSSRSPSRSNDPAGRGRSPQRPPSQWQPPGQRPLRRMRDGLSSMYAALSREVRAVRRDDRRADPPSSRSRRPEWDDAYPHRAEPGADLLPVARANNGANKGNMRRKKPAVRGCLLTMGIILVLFTIVGGGLGAGYAYAINKQYADTIASLAISRQFQTTRIFDRNGVSLYETYGKDDGRRTSISYCQMPQSIKTATVDTEDASFWQNSGVDPIGLIRSATIDLATHNSTAGASTITQQLVKLNVLSDSRKAYTRKLNEAILAVGVTQTFSKQKILEMYLNTIPYGYQNYGIEAAAHNYFKLQAHPVSVATKDPFEQHYLSDYQAAGCAIPANATTIMMSAAYQLQPWQAMLLAGIPQKPAVWDIFTQPKSVVYDRMMQGVMRNVQKQQHDASMFKIPDPSDTSPNYLLKKLVPASSQAVADFTFTFITKTDAKTGALLNIFQGANQDNSGNSTTLAPHFVAYVIKQLSDSLPGGFNQFASEGWNIYTTLDYGDPAITPAMLDELTWDLHSGQLTPDPTKVKDPIVSAQLRKIIPKVGMQQFAEFIVNRDINGPFPDYWYCGLGLNAALYDKFIAGPAQNPFSYNQNVCLMHGLNGVKNVHNAALTALDPRNGDILAMVGSVDFNSTDKRVSGQFNVATSPNRSLGSSFKPIVYATAFQMGWYPGIVIRDQPTCFPSAASSQTATDKYLCPTNYLTHNYERSNWSGAHPITWDLGNSLNTPAELALAFDGSQANASNLMYIMAQRLGIDTLDPTKIGPATALGSQGVPLLEETSAYGTFANQGYRYPPRSILAITSALGADILAFEPVPTHGGYQAISPQAAYMITSILTNNNARVGDFGPSNPLYFGGRDVAAKTGTSQDVRDIVTMGYTPSLSLGVWAGNADNSSMVDVIGIAGAGYIFHDVMQFAITRLHMPGTLPSRLATPTAGGYFPVPTGMHQAIVSCHTGLAPYAGEDVTTELCNPHQDNVPLFLTTETDGCSNDNAVSPVDPNVAHAACLKKDQGYTGDPAALDTWYCLDWGCKKDITVPGINQTWIVNTQDPLIP